MTTHHIYTSKNYVLRTIREAYTGDAIDVMVFPSSTKKNEAYIPKTYDELVEILKDYGMVYSFNEVEVLGTHRGFDIIIEE